MRELEWGGGTETKSSCECVYVKERKRVCDVCVCMCRCACVRERKNEREREFRGKPFSKLLFCFTKKMNSELFFDTFYKAVANEKAV